MRKGETDMSTDEDYVMAGRMLAKAKSLKNIDRKAAFDAASAARKLVPDLCRDNKNMHGDDPLTAHQRMRIHKGKNDTSLPSQPLTPDDPEFQG
jgi:hypothetical protein